MDYCGEPANKFCFVGQKNRWVTFYMKKFCNLFLNSVFSAFVISTSAFADEQSSIKPTVVAVLEEFTVQKTTKEPDGNSKTALLSTPLLAGKALPAEDDSLAEPNKQLESVTDSENGAADKLNSANTTKSEPTAGVSTPYVPLSVEKDRRQQNAIELAVSSAAKKKGKKLERKDRAAIAEFYKQRDFEPVWTEEGRFTDDARALIAYLSAAEQDGLNAADYVVGPLEADADIAAISVAEVQMSAALLRYARHAQAGRIRPGSISGGFKQRPAYPNPQSVMTKLSISADKVASLASYHPPHAAYKALRVELKKVRSEEREIVQQVVVPDGKSMYRGYRDERVAILRERLNVPIVSDEDPLLFDDTLKSAVRAFQSEHNLIADGVVGPKTLRAMNGNRGNRIHDLIANMEYWRWMARDMGKLHVMANVPSFNVTIYKNGNNIHRTRVVVGKTKHKTPIFSDTMEFVVVNPYWNVPYSIASKELLPRIRSNPGFVKGKNYEVVSGSRVVNPLSVNWNEGSFRRLRIRQRPGGGNALGEVKFLFPNSHAIYFHDTPSKSLFQRVSRAFSHGCVRIYKPFEFGNVIMNEAKGWKNGRLKSMVGGTKERWIKLKKNEQIPVHITYFTAVADEEGSVSYKSDVYGHTTRLKRALGLI